MDYLPLEVLNKIAKNRTLYVLAASLTVSVGWRGSCNKNWMWWQHYNADTAEYLEAAECRVEPRVFGLTEKDLEKKDTILQPEEYEEVLGKHGTVHHVGVTVLVKDWKSESEKGEVFHRTEGWAAKSVTKPNLDMAHINPKTFNKGVGLKSAKVKDVTRLLAKHFGEDWRSHEMLKLYRDLENLEAEGHNNEEDENIIVGEEIDTEVV
ncbi:hypothetical protein J6590_091178 [Homalodisca vitripennis]|nr:hypothetical protein J6590_091178 [Homalodisca vitripennis]